MASRTAEAAGAFEPRAGAIDLAHLERATFGDKALAREVLTLFDRQAEKLVAEIAGERSVRARREAAHTLKGAARGVGAFAVAQAAEEMEAAADNPEQFAGTLAHLAALVAVARLAVAGLIARD
jgi:HPt (histidine-containing phosphotransfer) domain-containing protein